MLTSVLDVPGRACSRNALARTIPAEEVLAPKTLFNILGMAENAAGTACTNAACRTLASQIEALRRNVSRLELALHDASATLRLSRLARRAVASEREDIVTSEVSAPHGAGIAAASAVEARARDAKAWALGFAVRGLARPKAETPQSSALRLCLEQMRLGESAYTLPILEALAGNCGDIMFLAAEGVDVDAAAPASVSPLWVAACMGHADAVQTLCALRATLDATSLDGSTPLSAAAALGHVRVVRHLCDLRADVDRPRLDGMTPLCLAALAGQDDVVGSLCARGADRDLGRVDGCTPLFFAISLGHVEIVRCLCAAPLGSGGIHRSRSCMRKHSQGMARSIELLETTSLGGLAPLHIASLSGHSEIALYLLHRLADVEALVQPIGGARQDGIGPKQVAGVVGQSSLHLAAYFGHSSVAVALLAAGADRNAQGGENDYIAFNKAPPLCLAAGRGHAHLVEILCSNRACLQVQAGQLDTPLARAAYCGHSAAASMLVRYSTDLHGRSSDGVTPMHLAANRGHVEAVKVLCASGADVKRLAVDGASPLHSAATSGSVAVVRTLCSAHAEVDVLKNTGATPLHVAIWAGHLQVVRCLRSLGANVQRMVGILSSDELAMRAGHPEIAQELAQPRAPASRWIQRFARETAVCSALALA